MRSQQFACEFTAHNTCYKVYPLVLYLQSTEIKFEYYAT